MGERRRGRNGREGEREEWERGGEGGIGERGRDLMCSHKYSDPQHSVSQQDCRNLSYSVYNSLPSLVLKRVSTRAGTLPLCPLTLSSPSTLTRKSVNASSVVNVYEVSLAGLRIGFSCLFRRRKSALLIKTSYPSMKAGSTSGTFHDTVKPN